MGKKAIQVDALSKVFRIGQEQKKYKTIRESLVETASLPFQWLKTKRNGNDAETLYWALRNVSFEVERGDVVGVIGGNGAGKSTLLKILSRVTEPTEGTADINGRVGSLLEVGTGFHPELSGRDNIYLNGAILGMKKAEIERKFDEIIAFAEIAKFIDTPVKRYSSGMYLRLAFSVAAHLEPEIMLVDEVLAVGDAAFQRKCLGRLQDVAEHAGRTILFVSHNMQAVQWLCNKVVLLDKGRVAAFGETKSVINKYLTMISPNTASRVWTDGKAPGNHEITLRAMRVFSGLGEMPVFSSSHELYVQCEFEAHTLAAGLCVGFDLVNSDGSTVFRSYQTDMAEKDWPVLRLGLNCWRCAIPAGFLNAGIFYVCPRISIHNKYWIVNDDSVVQFEVILDHGVSPFWASLERASPARTGVADFVLAGQQRDARRWLAGDGQYGFRRRKSIEKRHDDASHRIRRLTIGRLIYLAREKFGHGLAAAYYRDMVRPRIVQTAPVRGNTDRSCEIHVLTSSTDLLNLIWALKSFYRFSGRKYALCIHEDGSLTSEQIAMLHRHFPDGRIILRAEADSQVPESLQRFPLSLAFRNSNNLALKVFDFRYYLQSDRMLLVDSDVLFFAEPRELCVRIDDSGYQNNSCNEDIASAYTINEATARQSLGVELQPRFNSGLGLIHKQSLDVEWFEKCLSVPGILSHHWRVEQTLLALCSSRYGSELLPSEYRVHITGSIPGMPCRHYVGSIRHLMYKEGMRRLVKGGFLEQNGAPA